MFKDVSPQALEEQVWELVLAKKKLSFIDFHAQEGSLLYKVMDPKGQRSEERCHTIPLKDSKI